MRDLKLARKRLAALVAARRDGNVARACRELGISRSQFYKLNRAFEQQGPGGLLPEDRDAIRMPNALSPATIAEILAATRSHPSYSYNRVASLLKERGIRVSGGGVRKEWERRGISTRNARYLWVADEAAAGRCELSEHTKRVIAAIRGDRG